MPQSDNKLDAAIRELTQVGAGVTWVAETPVPLVVVTWADSWTAASFTDALFRMECLLPLASGGKAAWPCFRCVGLDRLPTILRSGCDVEPSNAVIFVGDSACKALEYGDRAAKVMLVFDAGQLRNCHREVPADHDAAELAELARDYPTRLVSEDGTHLWLSRLPEGSRRINTPYEVAYARWIPGDPFQALQAVVVLGHDARMLDHVRQDMAGCTDVTWRLTEPTLDEPPERP